MAERESSVGFHREPLLFLYGALSKVEYTLTVTGHQRPSAPTRLPQAELPETPGEGIPSTASLLYLRLPMETMEMTERESAVEFHRDPLLFLDLPAARDAVWLPGRQLCVGEPAA